MLLKMILTVYCLLIEEVNILWAFFGHFQKINFKATWFFIIYFSDKGSL